jgi:hypothetical protein
MTESGATFETVGLLHSFVGEIQSNWHRNNQEMCELLSGGLVCGQKMRGMAFAL